MTLEQLLYAGLQMYISEENCEALMGPIKVGSCQVFNLKQSLKTCGDLTINGIHVDTDILTRILFL
jgi:hypothetical protein